MYDVGTHVHYAAAGACQIGAVKRMDMGSGEKDYYELHPVYEPARTIYTAVDTPPPRIRPILTKEEAKALLENVAGIPCLTVTSEKLREPEYKLVIREGNCEKWVGLVKTVVFRKAEREASGKKITATDERYLKMVEEKLYGEVGFVLGLTKKEVEKEILSRIQN